jgi:hypothetical protein
MSTYRNTRRRSVTTVNPFENAEGNIPLNFAGLRLHKLGEKDFTSKRNDLALTQFSAINPTNGDTISVLVQCNLREQALAAFERAEAGEIVTLKVSGSRGARQYQTGATSVFAKSLSFEFAPGKPKAAALPEVSAGVLAAAAEGATSVVDSIQ